MKITPTSQHTHKINFKGIIDLKIKKNKKASEK